MERWVFGQMLPTWSLNEASQTYNSTPRQLEKMQASLGHLARSEVVGKKRGKLVFCLAPMEIPHDGARGPVQSKVSPLWLFFLHILPTSWNRYPWERPVSYRVTFPAGWRHPWPVPPISDKDWNLVSQPCSLSPTEEESSFALGTVILAQQ